MANEQLTIGQDKARLSVIGKSWPDMNFDSGIGLDLSQIIFDILIDLDIPMPDIDLYDLDDIPIIPGLDIDTEIPTLEYPDPDWPDDEIPPIIDWPMPDLDWDDFTDKLEDLDLDPDILKDLSFVGLNDLEIPELVFLDEDFNIQMDELPASIEIVTMPNKLEYQDGERIDLTDMVVTAKKTDGSTWTSAKYPNGHIPLGELIVEPGCADIDEITSESATSELDTGNLSQPVDMCGSWVGDYGTVYVYGERIHDEYHYSGLPMACYKLYSSSWIGMIAASSSPGVVTVENYRNEELIGTDYYQTNASYTYAGKTAYYYNNINVYNYYSDRPDAFYTCPINLLQGSNFGPTKAGEVAWTMVYGEISGGSQEINVSWSRPGDGYLLTTAFEIEVKKSGGGGR